ncbi:DUF1016 N-terminal domain-containing protein [Algoriphagus sp. Y33]|uniref:DUF1016 N-terminal domain-containing protein n=1 Tax=Algoriphagus sp. Y33 TaxID=2772483 RepID=UPI001CE0A475|nr:DUF1016 N-terminal domain-containing protein [Algoriphagus sp. Y33]
MSELSEIPLNHLIDRIKAIVEVSRAHISQTINATITATYWNVGKVIMEEVLENKRAVYGEEVIKKLSQQLTREYGKGWSTKQLQHCLHFAETFPNEAIVSALWRQLSWSHFKILMYQDSELKINFYVQMCRIDREMEHPTVARKS